MDLGLNVVTDRRSSTSNHWTRQLYSNKDPTNSTHFIPDWSLELFPLVPNVGDGCHEVSPMVHGNRAEQLQDLLADFLQKEFEVRKLGF